MAAGRGRCFTDVINLPYYRINRKVCQLFFRILPAASLIFCNFVEFSLHFLLDFPLYRVYLSTHCAQIEFFRASLFTPFSDLFFRFRRPRRTLTPVNVRRHRQLPLLQPLIYAQPDQRIQQRKYRTAQQHANGAKQPACHQNGNNHPKGWPAPWTHPKSSA